MDEVDFFCWLCLVEFEFGFGLGLERKICSQKIRLGSCFFFCQGFLLCCVFFLFVFQCKSLFVFLFEILVWNVLFSMVMGWIVLYMLLGQMGVVVKFYLIVFFNICDFFICCNDQQECVIGILFGFVFVDGIVEICNLYVVFYSE